MIRLRLETHGAEFNRHELNCMTHITLSNILHCYNVSLLHDKHLTFEYIQLEYGMLICTQMVHINNLFIS